MNRTISIIVAILFSAIHSINGFSVNSQHGSPIVSRESRMMKSSFPLFATEDATVTDEEAGEAKETTKKSLEDKMKEWEASEEEMKNASLGGMVPGRSDGFDIGLFLAFPFIVGSALLFAIFPFIMDKIDVSSVGPPPTV